LQFEGSNDRTSDRELDVVRSEGPDEKKLISDYKFNMISK
jgi:hypothetical protein